MSLRQQAATGRVDAIFAGVFLWIEAFLIWPDLLFSQGGGLAHIGLLLGAHPLVGDAYWGSRLKRWTSWVFCAVWVGAFAAWTEPTTGIHHAVFGATATLWWWTCWRRGRTSTPATIPTNTATEAGS